LKFFSLFILAIFLLPATALAADQKCKEPSITIDAEDETEDDKRHFEQSLRAAIKKVCNWWGPTYTRTFTVKIENSGGPSMALLPGWRGNLGTMLFRSRTTRSKSSAITHEVVHIFAPNGNRLLAEGFAIYAHEILAGRPAFPNFGRELHGVAKEFLESTDLVALDAFATPRPLKTDNLTGGQAYIVAGSFMKFLVNKYGMEKFRCLYELTPMGPGNRNGGGAPERWKNIYGADLKTLEKAWKVMVASR
jgi:hypothetical protein